MKILSIILASIYQDKLSALFDNLESTASDLSSFEVLIKVDEEDTEIVSFLENEKTSRPFSIKYIATPRRDGYWSLHIAYNELFNLTSEDAYFVMLINDETRFANLPWDKELRRYVGYFSDHIFHLRISQRREMKYPSLAECCAYGESYGFYTRKWLTLTEGLGKAGADTWQECVNYFLRTKWGECRGVPVEDIQVENETIAASAFHGLTEEARMKKLSKAYSLYARLLTQEGQEEFSRLAAKLAAQIWIEKSDSSRYNSQEHSEARQIFVYPNSSSEPVQSFDYQVNDLEWLSSLFYIRPIFDTECNWKHWPPIVANQKRARSRIAKSWLKLTPEQLERTYQIGDLGRATRLLLQCELKDVLLSDSEKSLLSQILDSIGDTDSLDGQAFRQNLISYFVSNSENKNLIQHLIAAVLYDLRDSLPEDFDCGLIPPWLMNDPVFSQAFQRESDVQIDRKEVVMEAEIESLKQIQAQLETRIRAMESSKFWKIRSLWMQLKQWIGLPVPH